MLISKSRFLNLIRCNRFVALQELDQKGKDALITFDPNSIEGIYAEEALERKRIILESLKRSDDYDEDDEDIDLKDLEEESPFEEDYSKIEILAARKLKNMYKGAKVQYGLKTFSQKHFEAEIDGYKFHCFLDVYVETEDEIIVVEVKASTSRNLLKKGGKNKLFTKMPSGIYYRSHEINKDLSIPNQKALFDPFTSDGRMGFDLAFQRYVIESSNKLPKKPIRYFLALLNHEYIYDGKKDENLEPIYSDDIITLFEYTKLTEELQEDLKRYSNIVITRVNNMDASPVKIGKHCLRNTIRECPYFNDICRVDKNIPDFNSIFTYVGNHYKFPMGGLKENEEDRFELIEKGYTKVLDFEDIDLRNDNQRIQRHAVLNDEAYYKYSLIEEGINMIKYPIYHLDFETFASPLPRFKGEKCYTQSVFQYSLHIEREPGVCDIDNDHYEYLVKNHLEDERELLYNHLISKFDDPNGMILAYNVSFEKRILRELNELFPYHDKLINPLIEDAFDLMHLLKGNAKLFNLKQTEFLYYESKLNGSFSIKKVLPIFAPHLDYSKLDQVQKGTDAVLQFSKLNNLNPADYNKMYQNLLAYCKLDTWAMVVVLDELRKKVLDK